MYQRDLCIPLGKKTKQPVTMKDEEWEVLDRKVLGPIQLFLDSSVAFNILKEKTTKGLMSTLANLYEKPLASNKVFLMNCLFNVNISEGGYVVDHLH